jgi:adenine-specific DNA-methyltransferase
MTRKKPSMKKMDTVADGASKDILAENIETLRGLFPEAFTEGSDEAGPRWKVDFEVLREILGDYTEEKPERYRFTWHGKSRARMISQTPSTGTLRPCPEESVDWDTTKNIFIEGDNLEVLKLLQKSYHKKVKMIYIDPPYNTGKEFIYPDKFADNLQTYLRYTGQVNDEGFKMSANAETSGRFHTNWLNMMYPRLKLARNLLREDGVIFITIDDNEAPNVRKLCDEIFGEENFVTSIAWQKKVSPSNDATWFSSDHDQILVYAKHKIEWSPYRLPLNDRQKSYYTNPDNDPRGPWNSVAYTCNKTKEERPNLYYPITNPNTGEEIWPSSTAVWAYSKEITHKHLKDKLIYWGKNGKSKSPRHKKFLDDAKGVVPRTVWLYSEAGHTQQATQELRKVLPDGLFETSKPPKLIRQMIKIATSFDGSDIVLDFFAGSGTTGQAILEQNDEDNGNRSFILVQLPEKTNKGKYSTVSQLCKCRIRKVIDNIRSRGGEKDAIESNLGLKIFKLDASNIIPWDPDFDTVEDAIFHSVDNLKPDRTEADILYEILLKYGLDLAVPIEERDIHGKTVFIVGGGALVVCLDREITLDTVQGIANLKDELNPGVMRVVFRDSGFKDDVVKTNTVQILKRAGIEDVKSL